MSIDNTMKLFEDHFPEFRWHGDLNSIRELAKILSAVITHSQNDNNTDLKFVFKLIRKLYAQHKCERDPKVSAKIICDQYEKGRPFENWAKVTKPNLQLSLNHWWHFRNSKSALAISKLKLIENFEKNSLIPPHFQSKGDHFDKNVSTVKFKRKITDIDKIINGKIAVMNSMLYFQKYRRKECNFLLISLINECLAETEIEDKHVDSIEVIIFENDDNIDLMENLTFFLERVLLKFAKNILIGKFHENGVCLRQFKALKRMLGKSHIVYQKFVLIFNEILIECNFQQCLISWFLQLKDEINT